MITQTIHNNRTKGSKFDQTCSFINSKPIGYIYTCKELRNWCSSVSPERLGYHHGFIMYAKCIKRVKRGQYEILAHLPEFVTYNMLEANKGYLKCIRNPKYGTGTESFYLHIPRGLKWFANEPNPYLQEEVKVEKVNEHVTEASGRMSRILAEGKTIEAVTMFDKRPIIILAITDTIGVVKFQYKDTGEVSHIALVSIEKGSIKIFEKHSVENKREQIINILKQGLSASDAADLILKIK